MDNLTYWNSKGKYQAAADALQHLVPDEGSVPNPRQNKALEKFRCATNCYYDLYNNGLCNRASQFARVFGFGASRYKETWRGYGKFSDRLYVKTEEQMDAIIVAAASEQGLDQHLMIEAMKEVPL